MHLSQLIDAASASVTEVNVSLQQAKMNIASSSDFTNEQKQKIMEALKPTEKAISNASASFTVIQD
jgi:C4-type Zn-finger protein